jgi:hypothetical protein
VGVLAALTLVSLLANELKSSATSWKNIQMVIKTKQIGEKDGNLHGRRRHYFV